MDEPHGYERPNQTDDQAEGEAAWDRVKDPQPHPNFPLESFSDGDVIRVRLIAGPWEPARWSEHNQIDMVVQSLDPEAEGERRILAPGRTLAARMRDLDPPPSPGDDLRIEQEGDGYEKDWLVERV